LGSSGFRSLDRHSLDPGDFRVQDRGFERLEQRQNRPRREQRAIESQRLAVVIPNAALRADGGHSRDARTFRISIEWLAAQSERGQAVDVDEKELKCSTPIGAPTRPKQSAQEKGATTSFTASAYWKFESTPLQRRVACELESNDYVDPEAMRFYPLLPIVAGVAQNATAALNSAA
jgi:hypothetical protein